MSEFHTLREFWIAAKGRRVDNNHECGEALTSDSKQT